MPISAKKLATILLYATLIFFTIITVIPFFWLICGALKSQADYFTFMFLPMGEGFLGVAWDRLTLANFHSLFTELSFATNITNSVFLASSISILATICGAMGGYSLSKFEFPGRTFITALVLSAPNPYIHTSTKHIQTHKRHTYIRTYKWLTRLLSWCCCWW